jgi:hypothetical protein
MNYNHIFRTLLPLRTYIVNQKYIKNKHGDIGVYKKKIKKWIKSNKPYRRQKRGFEKLPIYSTRFGFLDLYNRKEQQELICPSGYSISQCFNALRKLWYAFRRAIGTDKDIDKMKKYAKAIQDVQKDMGIKTASFPHLGLYGDALILRSKNGMKRVFEKHSELKKKQEEYTIRQLKNASRQETIQKPNKLNGETIEILIDDVSPYVKRDNEVTVPQLLEADEDEEIQALVDKIPFRGPRRRRVRRRGEGDSTLTIGDDVSPYENWDNEVTVPQLLEADEDEEIQALVDKLPLCYEKQDNEVTVPQLLEADEDEEIQALVDKLPLCYEKQDNEVTVPQLLEADEDEEIQALVDKLPFRRSCQF